MSEPLIIRLSLRVQPNASRSEVVGWYGEALRIRVAAPPSKGRANDAVLDLLAEHTGIRRQHMRIVRGHQSRDKVAEITTVNAEELNGRLGNPAMTDGVLFS